ncbi:MAG: thymidine phosphorylase [Candidatus Eremiobacteraeota bacterium]|nr:thymidine phosphorylase [Candidatus Eremiobacteraeota bacterium]
MNAAGSLAASLIEEKNSGGAHSAARIAQLIAAYQAREVSDDLMTAWLRAVCDHGMAVDETVGLTNAMARSGRIIQWPPALGTVVDKHSTGGVGDAVSLIAVPIAAACGAKVAKLSGRALGHTGGTIDKLECIPGLRTDLSVEEFVSQVSRVGCAVTAATADLAPADKRMYALRDRTGTVRSVPLIAASILSKKMAGGAAAIVIDVKTGRGAFMQTVAEADLLARTLIEVGRRLRLKVDVLITDMSAPLADSVGDALELDEALTVLGAGQGSTRLGEVALEVARTLLHAGLGSEAGLARELTTNALCSGAALAKFSEMARAQGGRLEEFDRRFPTTTAIEARKSGVVSSIDARKIGELVSRAKAGVPPLAARRIGVRLDRRPGNRVRRGDVLMRVAGFNAAEAFAQEFASAVQVGAHGAPSQPPVLSRLQSVP